MKFRPEKLFYALLAAALLTAAGCATAPRERVADALDADGELYFVAESTGLIGEASSWLDAVERRVAESESPNRDELQSYLTALRMLLRFAGVDNIEAVGASSLCDESGAYLNRGVAVGKTGTSWPKDPGQAPAPHLSELRALPGEVLCAVSFSVDAETVIDELRDSGAEELLGRRDPVLLGFSIREALTNASGKWQAAILPPPGHDPAVITDWSRCAFYLSLPDRGGAFFGRLAAVLPDTGNGVLRLSGGDAEPMFIAGGGERIRFYSSPDCLSRITAPKQTLGDNPLFKTAGGKLPEMVSGAFYIADDGGFGVWQLRPGMAEVSICSTRGAVLQTLRRMLLTPLSAAVDQVLARPVTPPEKPQAETAPPRRADTAAVGSMKKRRDLLAEAGKYLKTASETPGRYPAALPEKYASLVCFGMPGAGSAKLPLISERPDPKRIGIGVLFVDGTIEFFDFQAASLKHLCSFLHTRYHYDEKEFVRLIRRASELDARQKGTAHDQKTSSSH